MHFAGDFTGSSFTEVDPETGFLYAPARIKSNHAVDLDSKDSDVSLDSKSRPAVKTQHDVLRNSLGQWTQAAGGIQALPVFSIQKKLEVINRLRDVWPDISLACRLSGISRWTFNNHVAIDKSFRECVDEFREMRVDRMEGIRFKIAETTAGALDRMAVLNAYRRETYLPKLEVEVKHTMSRDEALEGHRRMEQAIDAEVVETFKRLRPPKP